MFNGAVLVAVALWENPVVVGRCAPVPVFVEFASNCAAFARLLGVEVPAAVLELVEDVARMPAVWEVVACAAPVPPVLTTWGATTVSVKVCVAGESIPSPAVMASW